jgi:glycosyltransferase involved in cell wall biosynthesis
MRLFWINHIYLDTQVHSTRFIEMAKSLSEDGNEVQLIVPSVKIEKNQWSNPFNNIRYIPTIRSPYPASMTFYVLLLFYLLKTLKKEKSCYLIVDPPSLPVTLVILFLFGNTKLILDIRSPPVVKGVRGFLQKMQYYVALAIARHFYDGITVITPALKADICSRFSIDSSKVGVWTSGVSLRVFDSEKNETAARKLKKQLNLDRKFIIMYHGAFRDGLKESIEAIARLAPITPDIVFFILGTGPTEEKLKLLVKEKSLQDNVYFHKPVTYENVPIFVSMCDVGIIPLTNEFWHSSALKLLEYLAMEKPIIATDLPFHRQIFKYGECGLLISSNSPENIASAINGMRLRRDLLRSIGKIGRAIVEKHYSWKSKAEDFENFINNLQ